MSKVVYRKNGGRRRAGYPLLVLCAVLLFGFSSSILCGPSARSSSWKTARPHSSRRSA